MKKIIPFVFVLVALALVALFFWQQQKPKQQQEETVYARIVTPVSSSKQETESETILEETDTVRPIALLNLQSDETLLNAISVDINNDSFDDQIVSVKKLGAKNIFLVTGVYSQALRTYVRASEIETSISDAKSFSFSLSDITGEHQNALIYTGLTDAGESVLSAYLQDPATKPFGYKNIVYIQVDGTVFIQQIERNDAYSFAQTDGESFPIWVNSTDTSRSKDSLDQIQSIYTWSKSAQKYLKTSETRVTGKKIADSALERIQDGTVETFENFLSGMWYKTGTNEKSVRYIFFDPLKREIIFSDSPTQEVYLWNTSALRRNGIYLTSMNSLINNLVRRFDIALRSADEVHITINDDVKMPIKEGTLWDGTYKKVTVNANQNTTSKQDESLLATISSTTQSWSGANAVSLVVKNGKFSASTQDWHTEGVVAELNVKGEKLLQFRTTDGNQYLSGYYKGVIEKSNSNTQYILTLTPVSISASGYFASTENVLRFSREIQ